MTLQKVASFQSATWTQALHVVLSGAFALNLAACEFISPPQAETGVTADKAVSISNLNKTSNDRARTNRSDTDQQGLDFVEILRAYQALNRRLETIADPILLANADLCPNTVRDPGFSVHTVRDYPENLQSVARVLLPVTDAVSLRTVRLGSRAKAAGLLPGDQILQLNGHRLATGATAKLMYDSVARKALDQTKAHLSVRRGQDILEVEIEPELICDSPVAVFFSDLINGHADGKQIWMTSGLMRSESNDTMLALIIAHELAHNIDDAIQSRPEDSKTVELRADRMALVILHRAGYNLDVVLADWARGDHSYVIGQDHSDSHPSFEARKANFIKTRARIAELVALGKPISF